MGIYAGLYTTLVLFIRLILRNYLETHMLVTDHTDNSDDVCKDSHLLFQINSLKMILVNAVLSTILFVIFKQSIEHEFIYD